MTIALGLASVAVLVGLVFVGGYPIAMIGVPGAEVSNSMPPTIALVALGLTQAGIAITLEPLGRAWLSQGRVWAAVMMRENRH